MLALAEALRIRAQVYVAGLKIPLFWPMRAFISRNPLHGFDHLPFAQAVAAGEALFGGRGFPSREESQHALAAGRLDPAALRARIARQAAACDPQLPGIDWPAWCWALASRHPQPLATGAVLPDAEALAAARAGQPAPVAEPPDPAARLQAELLDGRAPYAVLDALYPGGIGEELDELVVKSCLDFFDEGQSAWAMPEREHGLFHAWRQLARRNLRFRLRRMPIREVLELAQTPEALIVRILRDWGVPEAQWQACITHELARLYGWAGFIRWRQGAHHYHWQQHYPADLVEYLALRLALGAALVQERARHARLPASLPALAEAIAACPQEMALRRMRQSGDLPPSLLHAVDDALARGAQPRIARLYREAWQAARSAAAEEAVAGLRALARQADAAPALEALAPAQWQALLQVIARFEREEPMLWLQAREDARIQELRGLVRAQGPAPRGKRPFAQAMFCIDVRSERIRRHLERVGDYQTFGIAGFFGVPVSYMPLGKGSEQHLCPVLLTPKNLVPELSLADATDEAALSTLSKALHELKESVFSPFVTVEAVGMLFGLDLVGKTLAPVRYLRWRRRLEQADPAPTRLLLDRLSEEQADSIVRALQRAVIAKAVRLELGLSVAEVTDAAIRELREAALGHQAELPVLRARTRLPAEAIAAFVQSLRTRHGISREAAARHREHLARIGFTLEQQAGYVAQALRSIGLVEGFSRFVLVVGHGSSSQNNPYESALDCGACGGSHGLVSARVLAQMGNRPDVRARLRAQGIAIPDDTWFVPALHDTTTDEIHLHDLELLPASHLLYLDRLREGLAAASGLCAAERLPALGVAAAPGPAAAARQAQRQAADWSQVRPEWGLAGNAWFVIARREATVAASLHGRAFLHSYDWRLDPKRRLLETILSGPLIVGHWINMEYYFSTVDNARWGSGSKVYHNVAGRFAVMTGNLSDLRTGLPAQTVLRDGRAYHEPVRLIAAIEAPLAHARAAIEAVVAVKRLVQNGWVRVLVLDPQTSTHHLYEDGDWRELPAPPTAPAQESSAA